MSNKLLREMAAGESGKIKHIKIDGELGKKIRDMGLIPGTTITVKGRAPLYDPVAITVLGSTLTLRNNESDYIIISTENNQ